MAYVRYEFVEPSPLHYVRRPPQLVGLIPVPPRQWIVPQPARQLTWLDREALAFTHALAIQFGYSGANTLSTEVGYEIAKRLDVPMPVAKRWFHRGLGGFVGLLVAWAGAPAIAAIGLGAVFASWLEHFDGSAR